MRVSVGITVSLLAMVLSGCKNEVNVIDVAAEAGYACAVHSTSRDHTQPIECFGEGTALPTGDYAAVGDQWQASLTRPVSLSVIGNKGLCVVDEGSGGVGKIKCLDKSTPDLDHPSLLPGATQLAMSRYDFERVELAITAVSDFYACAMGTDQAGRGTLLCWSKEGVTPIDLVNDEYIAGLHYDVTEIVDFSMGREQLCIVASTTSGPIADCLVLTVSNQSLSFLTSESANSSALQVAALGASIQTSGADQHYCWRSAYGDIGCREWTLGIATPGDYSGLYMGPKSSPTFGSEATLCVTTTNSLLCRGHYADAIMQAAFTVNAQNVTKVVITDTLACYLAKPGQRTGIACQGYQRAIDIPAHLGF